MLNGLPDLARLRQGKGLTLEKIAEDTKINLRYLQAIEENRFSSLPGGVYNSSYLRQYARAVDYDENELIAFCSPADAIKPIDDKPGAQPDWRDALRSWAMRRR
jgi:transcriptional regulator with XRE-family HTH domain